MHLLYDYTTTYLPMASAKVCGSSNDSFLSFVEYASLAGSACIGLYEISHRAASAALAAAFLANFLEGPVTEYVRHRRE